MAVAASVIKGNVLNTLIRPKFWERQEFWFALIVYLFGSFVLYFTVFDPTNPLFWWALLFFMIL